MPDKKLDFGWPFWAALILALALIFLFAALGIIP